MDNPSREVLREQRKLIDIIKDHSLEDMDLEELALVVESETNLNEALEALGEQVQDYELNMIVGLKNRITELTARKSRLEKTAGTYRAMILSIMEKTGQDKIAGALMTLSVRKVKPAVVVEDEIRIPSLYWKPQDPRLDRKAVLEALNEGTTIEGARLDAGGTTKGV